MSTLLLMLPLRCKRDLLLARQRARQLAGLLGYAPPQRLAIAARTFQIAWAAYQYRGRRAVVFQTEGNALQIFATGLPRENPVEPRPHAAAMDPRGVDRLLHRVFRVPPAQPTAGLRLETALPRGVLGTEDVAWAVRELGQRTPLNPFEEIREQNEELLRLLPELPAATPPARAERTWAA